MSKLAKSMVHEIHFNSAETFPGPTSSPIDIHHPLIQAFKQIEYGRLLMRTPSDQTILFKGNNKGPEAYVRIYSWHALDALIARGEIGFAEAYIAGLWDADDLSDLLAWGLRNADTLEKYFYGHPLYALLTRVKAARHANTISGSKRNILKHYDIGNEFYSLWLDRSMTYSCALFEGNKLRSLEDAQQAKYQRILRKLGAKRGDHILEIGCGWGAFAEVAARNGIQVTGITISEEQKEYAEKRLSRMGLQGLVNIELKDYRNLSGQYDHIVSIGMFEHVGKKYWPGYFSILKNCLKPGGSCMVQTITIDEKVFERTGNNRGFIDAYIFPGGQLPPKSLFIQYSEDAGLMCDEIYSFGRDYALTTGQWLTNFEAQKEKLHMMGYDDSFIRMWRFYLSCCIAAFETHRTDVMQVKLSHR